MPTEWQHFDDSKPVKRSAEFECSGTKKVLLFDCKASTHQWQCFQCTSVSWALWTEPWSSELGELPYLHNLDFFWQTHGWFSWLVGGCHSSIIRELSLFDSQVKINEQTRSISRLIQRFQSHSSTQRHPSGSPDMAVQVENAENHSVPFAKKGENGAFKKATDDKCMFRSAHGITVCSLWWRCHFSHFGVIYTLSDFRCHAQSRWTSCSVWFRFKPPRLGNQINVKQISNQCQTNPS